MHSETIGDYEIECSSSQVPDSQDWIASLAIYGASTNPMHRNDILPFQRVAVDEVFPTEAAAEQEARRVAIALIEKQR